MLKVKTDKIIEKITAAMRPINPMNPIMALIALTLWALPVSAQIKIGGNVYGGGNHAEVRGSTKVTVKAGDIGAVEDGTPRPLADPRGRVFGGARMANVGGNSFVHIDGENATDYILINQVYGGNDIAGQIGTAAAVGEELPEELTAVKRTPADATDSTKNAIDKTFNSYVRISTKKTSEHYTAEEIAAAANNPDSAAYGKRTTDIKPHLDAKKVYIGQLFGGGNGDFDYDSSTDEKGNVTHYIYNRNDKNHTMPVAQVTTDASDVGFRLPEQQKTYLEVLGGSIVYGYGGGNNATVKEQTVIHIDNPSAVTNNIFVDEDHKEVTDTTGRTDVTNLLCTERFIEMGINTTFSKPSSGEYQIGRFFGGNNKAEMDIRPTWNLLAGKVRNLYSGGNSGKMTCPEGLLLEIPEYSSLIVENMYGGCRMADVMPTVKGVYTPCTNLTDVDSEGNLKYNFPNELSARTLVRGGHVHNVYGGNDVTGNVYGGNAVGIYTTIYGNVYGGGNGAYPYTDSESTENDNTYGDFHYDPGQYSPEALNAFRPNAEQVSLRLLGQDAKHPTIIKGSVFVGGNCATLKAKKKNPMVELKIGSYVIAENVFLGNNGEEMIAPDYLAKYADPSFSTMELTDGTVFSDYMEGVAMNLKPDIVFDSEAKGDPHTYIPNSSYIGSFYCGGNVGSMAIADKMNFTVNQELNIYNKFVGGCNKADVAAREGLNAAYQGGVIGSKEERNNYTDDEGNIKDRLQINFENMTITPLRWKDDSLVWNTQKWDDEEGDFVEVDRNPADSLIRLLGGNIYGGCYESGHVNGNVIININEDVLNRTAVFGTGSYEGRAASGVKLKNQRDDLAAVAMTVFGAGYGENTEIWGSTTVNHNNGYVLQVFGGGEEGVVGKKVNVTGEGGTVTQEYQYNKKYSTTVNLNGNATARSNDDEVENLAEAEYLYGGGNEGNVCGNTLVNLGNGRIYDAFGGASDAEILGHTEVYIGRQPNGSGGYKTGFPWIQDIVYGGNDFGGTIHGEYEDNYDFEARLRDYANDAPQLHGYKAGMVPDVLKSSTYVEFLEGRVDTIFGGGYGYYNYKDTAYYGTEASMPDQHSAFVNIRPTKHTDNYIKTVFGGGTGYPGIRQDDKAQDRSYVLIDIPDGLTNFSNMEVFGAGSYNGLGMGIDKEKLANGTEKLDEASAIIDLLHGRIHNVYGGSFLEGVTRRTVVNVPAESSIHIDNIFGGAYGMYILPPCDVYETQVNYKNTSEKAQVTGAIYGGNNNERRSLFTQVNISSPVYSNKEKGWTGTIYGAGRGIDTWSEHTEVNMLPGARAYNVFGGGEEGHVLNSASVQAYMHLFKDGPSPQISAQDSYWKEHHDDISSADEKTKADALKLWQDNWKDTWTLGEYYQPSGEWNDYAHNTWVNLDRFSPRSELDDKTAGQLDGKKYNTNVIINKGAVVEGYAYGGGLGKASLPQSGDIYGTTYIAVLGGEVKKDVYAGGQAGGVDNLFGAEDFDNPENKFTATANAYIQGGTARNVYGGGYEGHVGHHEGDISASFAGDRLAKAHVVIGKTGTNTFDGGAPAITRNVYGGGEGGSVYGSSNVTINNGYIGYRYKNTGTADKPKYQYVEELDDQTPNAIEMAGNVFGGGYVINSYVDSTNIDMFGGTIRGSLYGGGEIGPVGRGYMKSSASGGLVNGNAHIYRAGTTNVNMFGGHVLRNVYGGGRGKDSWGGDGTLYMEPELVATLDMKSKGYVFGQTRVNIHGGEIGTDEGMEKDYGNVFGAGDEGSVYSAYMDGDNLRIGKKAGVRYNKGLTETDPEYNYQGYYYQWDGSNFLTKAGGERNFTEDCKVVVEPYAKTLAAHTINGTSYAAGDYVPIADLNTLKSKSEDVIWQYLDPTGIIIHNAVFAGGNVAAGSNSLYANETTVFGNATASIHDVYNRDLITIGTGHTGGLYGDGNLTFVDGYRELNITNYGTDYYHISKELKYEDYKNLPEREKAYYELKYTVTKEGGVTDIAGTTYSKGSNLPQDEIMVLFAGTDKVTADGKPDPAYWQENGVVSVYAGRIMNTIQRADFCGVFGSRMVMKGAPDRVPEHADYTNYTINRVREVSLNKIDSKAGDTGDDASHGNYFGIYSVVNYLGALTSDVKFDTVRTTNSADAAAAADGKSFYAWKELHKSDKMRNNGTCHNHLALASGVYLELTTELSTGDKLEEKDWGPITGVIELDLINVQPGIGGGFVYAKNEHGVPTKSGIQTTTLTALNKGAASKWDYNYATNDSQRNQWETSGNFIHSSQTIIDDCYNISNRYLSTNFVPAHYWYISGSVYVYDQYISAYTGSPNAFSETVEVPITINAAAHGTMTLMDVQPNRYAYYANYTSKNVNTPLTGDQKLVLNDVTYQKNTPISYWDWYKLPAAEQLLFVEDTYVVKDSCFINSTYYPAGYVMLPEEYNSLKTHAVDRVINDETVKAVWKATLDEEGNPAKKKDNKGADMFAAFDDVFRSSNNMSHNTGYLLTYNVTNPKIWDKWYTEVNSSDRAKRQTPGDGYQDGPTYHPTTSALYGQQQYGEQAIIPKKMYDDYEALGTNKPSTDDQATFVPAHLVTSEYIANGQHYYPGAPVAVKNDGYTDSAYVSTATIQLSPTEFIYVNDLMTKAQKNQFKTDYPSLAKDIDESVVPAYYCTKAGLYGGSYYETGKNYRALEAYSAMSPKDREQFAFNYDALDLLIDPDYGGTVGKKYQYDSEADTLQAAQTNAAGYSLTKPIDYTATYEGDAALSLTKSVEVKRSGSTISTSSLQKNDELLSPVFESLPNEQHHYAPIVVKEAGNYYIVKESFVHGDTPYAVGKELSGEAVSALAPTERAYIDTLHFDAVDVQKDGSGNYLPYYYCRESYTVGENGEGVDVTKFKGEGNASYTTDGVVPVGFVINATNYASLPNKQKEFTIHGVSPMETSTLYVARHADIHDLSTEKIITVIYKYDYEESDVDGMHITPVSERHVLNIHIKFKSGVPTVDDINAPTIVLPGTGITMRIPTVTPGAYEVIGGGWELFENESNAESHINGVEYTPSVDPLYWYQDGFQLAYYAKTFLGKTYSNHVPVSVANYHDLKRVMTDSLNHLHVDYDRTRLKRDSKIYINDYSGSKNGLDLFKDFYDLSVLTVSDGDKDPETGLIRKGRFEGHKPLNNSEAVGTNIYDGSTNTKGVKAGKNLEFFLRTDIDHPEPWTTIGTDDVCFKGNLHGDGHTISGLNNSLFYNLCGSVYNLGVKGSFTSAGVVDKGDGYVESSWVNTTATPAADVRAVFGNPTAESGIKQLVNSYCQTGKTYVTTDAGSHGIATAKSDTAFYNGEVAYDLNNFYLYKRYSDHSVLNGSAAEYKYWLPGNAEPQTGRYLSRPDLCSSGYDAKLKYVEERFADGDFRYAAGEIPTWDDERRYVDTENDNKEYFFPIWPDDYIFFGQRLTYGYGSHTHQNVPTAVVRSDGRIANDDTANRVYRAPAYYRSMKMGVAYFNPDAYLAFKSANGTKTISAKPMTAIDFAGHNAPLFSGSKYALDKNIVTSGSAAGTTQFYPPLLDDDGLASITNCDLTNNLLAYAPAAAGESGYINEKTHGVLSSYFVDPVYEASYDNAQGYRLVAENNESVNGHLVQSDLIATNDHLLVDKQDFNAPIAYTFDADHLMWYQRKPADKEFVDLEKGWQSISLPFTAELVTTDTKGEITHFFNGSNKGHEYWLREFNDIQNEDDPAVAKAFFQYPAATGTGKTVGNTFLWDYYYKNERVHNQLDKNEDTYLEYRQYYNSSRTYEGYPLLSSATPYIIGFPGQTYYEFDLSGKFEAQNTRFAIDRIGKQVITFASNKGTGIGVSDDEMTGKVVEYKGYNYTFKPSYMNDSLEAGSDSYVLNDEGSSFNKVPNEGTATSVSAFRPYFVAAAAQSSRKLMTQQIVFGGTTGLEEGPESVLDGSLEIFSRGRNIITRSHMKEAVAIRIVNAAGATLTNFVLQPEETIETPVHFSGVYIVNKKKVFVE